MLTFNDNKAGMSGLDKKKITTIIEQNTSATYSSFSQKQQQKIDEKTKEIKELIENASDYEKRKAEKEMNDFAEELETYRDLNRDCVCIDMDAYFAAVEMRDNPKLRTVPMAVGSQSMLSTSNYIARRYGVRAAMPGFIAKKLCSNLVIVPGNYPHYSKLSKKFASIFEEYDCDVGMMSLDEAYIDLTDYVKERTEKKVLKRHQFGGECICWLPRIPSEQENSENFEKIEDSCVKCNKKRITYKDEVEFGIGRSEIVKEIRFRVEQMTGLTCSAGIAANFMLAKICSDFNKPNGQFELENDRQEILNFLSDLPIRKVSGIGRVSEAHLKACEISTVGDMLRLKNCLPLVFSTSSQESFLRIALGLPGRPSLSSDTKRKSVSVERTFTPTSDFNLLRNEHESLCQMLEQDIRKIGIIGGKTITLKLKLSTFDILTRSLKPPNEIVISTLEDIRKYSLELLEKEKKQEIRLLGVRLSHLVFEKEESLKKNVKTIIDFWNDAKRKKSETATILCPICGKSVENNLEVVNNHVDECISKTYPNNDEAPELICIEGCSKKLVSNGVKRKNKKTKITTIDMFLKKK